MKKTNKVEKMPVQITKKALWGYVGEPVELGSNGGTIRGTLDYDLRLYAKGFGIPKTGARSGRALRTGDIIKAGMKTYQVSLS